MWAEKHMNVIRHDDEGVQIVAPEMQCVVMKNLDDHVGNEGLLQI